LNERAKNLPAVQMTILTGSLFHRDMRLWHGAMPNKNDRPRAMLDLAYMRFFPPAHERLIFPPKIKDQWYKSARKLLEAGVAGRDLR
jgi:ectoine hydroxylase-related dioxygenase (phytanoyl-CoA dioxygenase family)